MVFGSIYVPTCTWKHLRSYLHGGTKGDASESLDSVVRLAQFQYWAGGSERFQMVIQQHLSEMVPCHFAET
eukprot:4090992-Amphidinium_carterae.1